VRWTRRSDDAIDTMIEHFGRCPTPMGQVLLEHLPRERLEPAPSSAKISTMFATMLIGRSTERSKNGHCREV
jgi:hypothetical protein